MNGTGLLIDRKGTSEEKQKRLRSNVRKKEIKNFRIGGKQYALKGGDWHGEVLEKSRTDGGRPWEK